MPRTRPPYPSEFRARMIDLARSGRTVRSLSKEFGVTETTIHSWVRQADRDSGGRTEESPPRTARSTVGVFVSILRPRDTAIDEEERAHGRNRLPRADAAAVRGTA